MTEDDLARLQEALGGRLASCWDRLDDVISELIALHDVPEGEILDRVQRAILDEQEPDAMEAAL